MWIAKVKSSPISWKLLVPGFWMLMGFQEVTTIAVRKSEPFSYLWRCACSVCCCKLINNFPIIKSKSWCSLTVESLFCFNPNMGKLEMKKKKTIEAWSSVSPLPTPSTPSPRPLQCAQFFLDLGESYFLLLEYQRRRGMPMEGRVITPNAAQSIWRNGHRDQTMKLDNSWTSGRHWAPHVYNAPLT